jgi:hypothetical protein
MTTKLGAHCPAATKPAKLARVAIRSMFAGLC